MIQIECMPLEDDVRCLECGSKRTDAQLAREQASNPRLRGCCPERKPLTIDQWKERAWAFERQLRAAKITPDPAYENVRLQPVAAMDSILDDFVRHRVLTRNR